MIIKRALVCSYTTPQPDRDSGSRRILDLIDFLREAGWLVSFVASNGVGEVRYVRILQQRGVAVYDGATTELEEVLTYNHFDLAIVAFWPIAEFYLPILRRVTPATRIIVDSIDLHFLRDARRIFREPAGNGTYSLLDTDFASQIIGEMNVYAAADAVLTVSQKEADLINDLVADPRLAYNVPLSEELMPSTIPVAKRQGILFLGSFRHSPNVEAVEYLCKAILPCLNPAIMAEHPVYIVGDGLNEGVRSYGIELPQVRMVGWVPSVLPYLESARISVVPLLSGAGVKGKLVQALMVGTPTVSTSIGIEGLNLRDGEHILVAEDPITFANSIIRLLEDTELWERLACQGRAHITSLSGRQVVRECFMQMVNDVLSKTAKFAMLTENGHALYQQRIRYQFYKDVMQPIREVVDNLLPPKATVIVVGEGGNELLKLRGRRAWHFPQTERGEYAADTYPSDSSEAIAHLESLKKKGAEFLLFPGPALWWLNHYLEFAQHLDNHYRKVYHHEEVCVIYQLCDSADERQQMAVLKSSVNGVIKSIPESADKRYNTSNLLAVERELDSRLPVIDSEYSNGNLPGGSHHLDHVRLIAFYLPQYHPIPENDEWWGEGFTEWRNVVKAQPLFPGHYQPHLPADLGFYDLRCPETRQEQADMARRYGIHGFCYYHYWFNGKLLLERPFNEVLASGRPDFPFCLCWANEPWSRRWDGRPHDVLQPQLYSQEDDFNHIHWLLPALTDRRAIKIEGKPVFIVYQANDLPDPARTTELWRREVEKAGLPGIYLISVETGWDAGWDATKVGFDAKILFQPQFSILRTTPRSEIDGKPNLQVYDYQKAWPILASPEPVSYRRYDTVFPSWDNTARQGDNGTVVHNPTPEAYEEWLRHAIAKVQTQPTDHRIVFINAWNEWAEGAHLEPDLCNGNAYLEATRRVLWTSLNMLTHY